MSDIEKATIENAADQLRSKIKHAFIDFIPEEQWKKMIKDELEEFTLQRPVYRFGRQEGYKPSELHEICREVLSDIVKEKFKKTLQGGGWEGHLNEEISDKVKEWLNENYKMVIKGVVSDVLERTIQSFIDSAKFNNQF